MKRKELPFRYPGGKYYAMDILEPFWQAVPHSEYREPFAGGATVFFHKEKSEINWLNDLDAELMTCYRVMQNPAMRNQLAIDFQTEIASRERWQEIFSSTDVTDNEHKRLPIWHTSTNMCHIVHQHRNSVNHVIS